MDSKSERPASAVFEDAVEVVEESLNDGEGGQLGVVERLTMERTAVVISLREV